MDKYKIFLAGSTELDEERSIVRNAISSWNATEEHQLGSQAPNVTVYTYHNFPNLVDVTIGNEPYNIFIRDKADLAIFILSGTIGDKTEMEFNIAYNGLINSKRHPLLLVLSEKKAMDEKIVRIREKLKGDGKYYREYERKEEIGIIISDELTKFIAIKRQKKVLVHNKIIKQIVIVIAVVLLVSSLVFFLYDYPKKNAIREAKGAISYCDESPGYKCIDTLYKSKEKLENVGFSSDDPIMIEISNRINNVK